MKKAKTNLSSLEIQTDVRQKIIIDILLEFIYYTPALFDCVDFEEDTRSAFGLRVYAALPKIIENYDADRGKFITYLVANIRLLAKGFRRAMAKERAAQESLAFCYDIEQPKLFEIQEEEPEYSAPPVLPVLTKNAKRTLLVLAIKNAFTITETQINTIANITEFDREKLTALVERTKEKLKRKETMREKMVESRNHSFVLKTRYKIELEKLTQDTPQYIRVEKAYNSQTRLLDSKNDALKTRLSLIPNDSYIGSLLGIQSRIVKKLIADAAKNVKIKNIGDLKNVFD